MSAKPDLVLVPGWAMPAQVWDGLLPALERDYRVWRLDLPGQGERQRETELSGADLAAPIADQLNGPAHWLGWSLGGMLTLQLAQQRPALFARLALVGCNPCFVARPDWPGMAPEVFAAFEQGLANDPAQTLRRFAGLVAKGERQREVLKRLQQLNESTRMDQAPTLSQGLALLRELDLRDVVAGLHVPMHWLLGEQDALVPATVAESLARLHPAMRIDVLPGAGHAPFLAAPERFSEMIVGWAERSEAQQ